MESPSTSTATSATRWPRSSGTPRATTSSGIRSSSLLNALGTVQETHKGHVQVTIDGQTETFEPLRHKDIDAEQLSILRRLLKETGFGPEGPPE